MKGREKTKCIITGGLAGLANGLFGAGGGMFLVPLFCRWLKIPDKEALATSLAVVMPLSIASSVVYFLNKSFEIKAAAPFLIGGLLGGALGGKVFKKMPAKLLRRALAIFIIYGGVRSLFLL